MLIEIYWRRRSTALPNRVWMTHSAPFAQPGDALPGVLSKSSILMGHCLHFRCERISVNSQARAKLHQRLAVGSEMLSTRAASSNVMPIK